jgi:hypothetical protein
VRVRWCRVVQVNALRPLDEYKQLEADLNAMGSGVTRRASDEQLPALQARWRGVASQPKDPGAYTSFGAEVVEQMLVGAGWRVCARHRGVGTESVLVRSADPRGVRFIVTALLDGATLTPSEATAKASAVRVLPHLTAGESPPLPLSPPRDASHCHNLHACGGLGGAPSGGARAVRSLRTEPRGAISELPRGEARGGCPGLPGALGWA